MTDRELIERLLFLAETAVDQALDLNYDDPEDYFIYRELRELKAVVAAQPEPQGPTGRPAIEPVPVAPTNLDAEFRSWYGDRYGRSYFGGIALVECVEWTQFVLARWGTPTAQPVPVSERLPGPEDCDKEGCCWWWDYGQDSWSQGMPEYCINRHTHWLPHYALPVPGVEGADA